VSIIVEVILTSIFYITKRSGCLVAARANKSPHLDLVFTFEMSLFLCAVLSFLLEVVRLRGSVGACVFISHQHLNLVSAKDIKDITP